MIELTRKLTEAWGPSGYEHHVRKLIEAEVKDLADEITVDPLGNLICRVGKGGTKIMIAAHMDEIGVMTTFVEPKSGYLRFANVGGLLHTTLIANRVQFENGVTGVISVEDMWGGARTNVPNLESFYIDVSDGNGSGKVQPGMPGVFAQRMEQRGTRLIGKAMDDRIGCIVAIETMRRLKKKSKNEVYFVFTVQEEVGLRGARPAAYNVDPDVGIALDVTGTGDELHGRKMGVKLGDGAAIKINDPGLVVPPAVRDWMVDRAEKDKVPYQRELLAAGTTDASGIQMARAGVPSGCISIPCRYIHTTSETVDTRDVEACIALLTGLVKNPVKL
jgi:tetrahedral aminopeptidase